MLGGCSGSRRPVRERTRRAGSGPPVPPIRSAWWSCRRSPFLHASVGHPQQRHVGERVVRDSRRRRWNARRQTTPASAVLGRCGRTPVRAIRRAAPGGRCAARRRVRPHGRSSRLVRMRHGRSSTAATPTDHRGSSRRSATRKRQRCPRDRRKPPAASRCVASYTAFPRSNVSQNPSRIAAERLDQTSGWVELPPVGR